VLAAADLAGYRVVERAPLWGRWRGLRVATMPLPSSGGLVLLEVLGILDALEARGVALEGAGAGSSATLHLIAEALKHGFADRARLLGDTDDARALAATLLEPAALAQLAARIDPARVGRHAGYGRPALARPAAAPEGGGTSHLCVVDAEGNAVALTTTVNRLFGAQLVTPGGVVLNNQMDDFALEAGVPNAFGLVQSEQNLVAPGKRPLSSMTPVLLLDGDRVVGCAGGSGGPHIISNVVQVLLATFVFGQDVRAAVEAPRIHHQWLPVQLRVEAEIPRDVRDGLTRRGHELAPTPAPTAVQAIRVLPDGTMQAASDPRKAGAPAAPPPR
jgi:gamma-glutamyltranspeptidase / glutathione hydrolase